jgi:acetyl/propionyl-CoA carboxylase alpha subunit
MTGHEIHWESADHGILRLDGRTITFTIRDRDATGGWIEIDGKNQRFYVHRSREEIEVWLGGRTFRLGQTQKAQTTDGIAAAGSGEIRAQMPGKIRRVDVSAGERVAEKQSLIVMESMKMESTLAAPHAGTVSAVKCQVGQIVEMGELLVVVESEASAVKHTLK